jgi:hypothetical protein
MDRQGAQAEGVMRRDALSITRFPKEAHDAALM